MIVSTDSRLTTPRWLRTTGRVGLLCALPLGLIYCDWATAVDEETEVDPVEESAPVGLDELGPAAGAAGLSPSLLEAEYQDLVAEYQDIIREGMEAGALSGRRGPELNAYLTGWTTMRLMGYALDNDIPDDILDPLRELLVAEMVERNRGLVVDDYSSRISSTDLQSPELKATLAELEELMKEFVDDPDAQERFGEWSSRVHELRTRLLETIGRLPESQE